MTEGQWKAFCSYRDGYRSLCAKWNSLAESLFPLQKAAALKDTPEYPLENAVVYNTAYDKVTQDDEINYIVIGDNPGKEEQLNANCAYLVGQSGRIAEGFFKRNAEFYTDFRKNVIIMNKTPVHTAKTAHLKFLKKNGGPEICTLIDDSQRIMAQMAAELHRSLYEYAAEGGRKPELWLVGYSELKEKGIFSIYRDTLLSSYKGGKDSAWESVFVFQHFSMNRFLVDLNKFKEKNPDFTNERSLKTIGRKHRIEIFGK